MGNRKEKIERQIQKDLAVIVQKHSKNMTPGKMLTVTNVIVSPDLGSAKIYISIFPTDKSEEIIKILNQNINIYRKELGNVLRNQVKKIPEIAFYLDDSIDYYNKITNLINK